MKRKSKAKKARMKAKSIWDVEKNEGRKPDEGRSRLLFCQLLYFIITNNIEVIVKL